MLCAWWLLDGSWQGLHDYDLIPDIELLYLFDDYHENVLVAYCNVFTISCICHDSVDIGLGLYRF